MIHNKNINPFIHTRTPSTHPGNTPGIRRFIGIAALVGLTSLAATLTPTLSHASPPAHANASDRAKSNFSEEALPARAKRGSNEEWARGRILVTPRAGLPAKALANILREHGGKPTKIGQSDLYVVELPEYTEEGVIARLARHPHIKFAEFDHYVAPTVIPNDPYYPNGWHLPKIGAPAAWGDSLGSDITIAILDSGVEGDHPDLAAKMVPGWNFFDNNSNTSDVSGHGTRVAGAAAALTNNGIGVAGVARHSPIMPIRITDTNGWGTWSGIANGLVWAADRGVRVANISFVGVSSSLSARNAAQYMKNKNGLVIVAAGNTGNLENYTATDTMIPVAATTSSDARASWSSYGNYVLLSAPGANIWTTRDGKSYGASNGTSFSSPITAGVIALMMAANPSMKNTDIEHTLFTTAIDLGAAGWDPYFGHGRVDAGAAVQAVVTTETTITSPKDTEPPRVSILEPLSGATVSGLVPVDIEATDNVGVVRTELWVNHTSVAVDTSEPFAFSWDSNGTPNGKANLVVRAFDAAGNSAASNIAEVNVENPISSVTDDKDTSSSLIDTTPPVVQIINPVGGNVSHNVTITVNASDDNGDADIALAIYIDGQRLATGTGSTLSANWNTRPKRVSAGAHTIQATAKDAAGNTATTSVNVNVVK